MRLQGLSIRLKTFLLVGAAAAAMWALAATLVFDFRQQASQLKSRQAETVVLAAKTMLMTEHLAAKAGEIDDADARARAKRMLEAFRYDDGDGYVAVVRDDGLILAHPDPNIAGTPGLEIRDGQGRYVVREAIEIGKAGGVGFNRYMFENPVTGVSGMKTSAIGRFEPWGWTLSAVAYDNKVDTIIASLTSRAFVISALLIAGFILLALAIADSVVRPLRALTKTMTAIAGGALSSKIPYADLTNEVGRMAQALSVFRDAAAHGARMKAETDLSASNGAGARRPAAPLPELRQP